MRSRVRDHLDGHEHISLWNLSECVWNQSNEGVAKGSTDLKVKLFSHLKPDYLHTYYYTVL